MAFQDDIAKAQKQLAAIERNIPLAMPEATKAAAELMRDRAKELAPVGTGALRNSIKSEEEERTAKSVAYVVFAGKFYAPFLEFGTSKMAARPFMRPAFDAVQPDIKRIIESAVSAAAKK